MTTENVNVTINGLTLAVPKGTTIIEAAKQAGVLIPHYCYHPSLPSPAVCRMCLVEVEKAPKLMPACVTTVAEGQVVHVDSEQAKKAREGVLELLLINHPLDCPICDQAGECELQNYVFQEGRAGTRYSEYAKRYNPVEEFGPDVLYVANRCILCTRCVRFMDDVAGEAVLNVSERGDRAYIGIDPEHELDHAWAGNVVDLCPVGSLISKDFLHKARAWDLDKTASICTGCSQGCNILIDTRDAAVVRLRPRPNLEVNRHFICDHGRMNYRWMNRGDRIEAPLVRESQRLVATDWDQAIARVVKAVRQGGSAVVLASGRASTESLGMVKRLLEGTKLTATVQLPQGDEAPLKGVPNLALRKERAPNGEGARILGYTAEWSAALKAASSASLVVLLDVELTEAEATQVGKANTVVVFGTVQSQELAGASVVLPVTNVAEEIGTFVNRDGRVQRYDQAKPSPGMAQPAWWVAAAALALISGKPAPAGVSAAFDQIAASLPALNGLTFAGLGFTGRVAEKPVTAGAAS
ncbi:MAG TPA: 2Fe-2S iron-sulfur cluster-binding protein [Gemmatimonadales bacterium]|jgi:NADH-quinone oxidoreductase subunit G|nr:2Fe-2S iron-sulfur cluster-binding protein [Gemmatimonadales bacterium]